MQQVQVSIGRSTSPGVSMYKTTWYNFQRAIDAALWEHTRGEDRWIETHKGEGLWDDFVEESAHITVLDVSWVNRWALTVDLARIARHYGQSAIALTVTEPELIAAG